MKSKSIGWLILVAALAIPAFFFQNFMKKMKSSAAPTEVKRAPEGSSSLSGGVRSQPDGGLPNPIRGSSAPAPGSSDPTPGAPAPAPGAPALASSGTPSEPAGQEPGTAAPPASPSEPSPGSGAPSQAPADATGGPAGAGGPGPASPTAVPEGRERIEYAPQSDRDPTLSVIDEQKLAVERETARMAEAEMRSKLDESKNKKKKVVREKPAEDLISVQGIITMDGGNAAIVNDEVRRVGDKVSGCTLTRVTSKQVFFRCGGKTFYKTVQ